MRVTRFVGSLLISALLSPSAHAQTSSSSDEQRVLATDEAYVQAEVRRDEAALRRMVDDRFVYNASNATTTGKEALIQRVMQWNMTSQTLRERSVLVEGTMAIVFGTTDMRFAEEGKPDSLASDRYTCGYVKRDGEWKMIALQMQPRAATP